MPWSAKAQVLLQEQYAAVGAAARGSLDDEVEALEMAAARGLDVGELSVRARERRAAADAYVEANGRYCWPVHSIDDLKLAPFHLLATEGKVHITETNDWHVETLKKLAGGIMMATPYRIVDITNPDSEADGIRWWEELTARGGEGMVVKPRDFIARGRRRRPGIARRRSRGAESNRDPRSRRG